MSVRVKICGITRARDAVVATELGATYLGINFWPGSKRHTTPAVAQRIAAEARKTDPKIRIVGVFVNQPNSEIDDIIAIVGLDYVQLHGDETPNACALFGDRAIKAVSLASRDDVARIIDYPCNTILVDTPSEGYGGSGRTFDWTLAAEAVAGGKQVLLAGGLTPENVAAAVETVRPFGVDVASGVESGPGIKDEERVRRFISAALGARPI